MLIRWFKDFKKYLLFHTAMVLLVVSGVLLITSVGLIFTGSPVLEGHEYKLTGAGDSIGVENDMYQYAQLDSNQQQVYDEMFHGSSTYTESVNESVLPNSDHVVNKDGTFYSIQHDTVVSHDGKESAKPFAIWFVVTFSIVLILIMGLPKSRIPDKHLADS